MTALNKEVESATIPPLIYHYTDSIGLFGILESKSLRLTDAYGLNDPSELRFGMEHVYAVLKEECAHGDDKALKPFSETFGELIRSRIESVAHFFVASFSRNQDELGQWRAYANNGRGFALGFNGPLLVRSFQPKANEAPNNCTTFNLMYTSDSLLKVHRALVREVTPLIQMAGKGVVPVAEMPVWFKEISVLLAMYSMYASIFFKHPAYRNEEEYRFLQVRGISKPIADLKTRARNYSVVRFIEVGWDHKKDLLKQVVIGPAADKVAARAFVEDRLRASGLDGKQVEIIESAIPYRGL